MSDLTDAELLAATTVHDRLKAINETAWVDPVALIQCDQLQRAALEIQRHRSALAADDSRVRSVVTNTIDAVLTERKYKAALGTEAWKIVHDIATRAAEQLATAAVRLGPDDFVRIQATRDEMSRFSFLDQIPELIQTLDRILGAKP